MEFPDASVETSADVLALRGGRIGRGVHAFGFYSRDGAPVANSEIVTQRYSTRPLQNLKAWPANTARGPRRAVFGGFAATQFGHVVTRSLGRLWATDAEPDTPLLFLSQHAPSTVRFLRPLLDLLGVRNQIVFLREPLRLRQAVVPNDLFGEAFSGAAAPEFRDWIARRLPPAGPIRSGSKVYLTRSAMGDGVGRIACEDVLEENLATAGYEIFAPERASLREQIETYQTTETLLFAESSALHLHALVKRPDQKCGVIARRREIPPLIETQLTAFEPTPARMLDAIVTVRFPPWRADNIGRAALSFQRLRDMLLADGFITAEDRWRAPSPREVETSMAAGLKPDEALVDEADRDAFLTAFRERRRNRT